MELFHLITARRSVTKMSPFPQGAPKQLKSLKEALALEEIGVSSIHCGRVAVDLMPSFGLGDFTGHLSGNDLTESGSGLGLAGLIRLATAARFVFFAFRCLPTLGRLFL